MPPRRIVPVVFCGVVMLAACGRKGPPLPPLRPVPGPVAAVTARRLGDQIELHFTIPTTNTDKTSPAAVSRVEIYARSTPAASLRPVQAQIALKENLVGTIDVKPPVSDKNPPTPGAAPTAPPDPRPATGDAVTFRDTVPAGTPAPLPALKNRPKTPANAPNALGGPGTAGMPGAAGGPPGQSVIPTRSPESRTAPPATTPPPATPPPTTPPAGTTAGAATSGTTGAGAAAASAAGAAGTPGTTVPAKAAPAKPLPAMRYFWVQAVASHGQVGAPADLIAVPLTAPPAPASAAAFDASNEKTLTFSWTPGAEGQTFRVYDVDRAGKEKNKDGHPLNDAPLKTPEFQLPMVFDEERCLAVRAVDITGNTAVESDPVFTCVTPKDIFPPAVPANLNGLPDVGTVALRWDPVTAPDLAGYLVLRGEGTGDTLQQLTASPVAAATYVDSTVRPGVTYVYVVVAVDTTGNRSAHSNAYTVTIR